MTNDAFANTAMSIIAPARTAFPIVPSNTEALTEATRAIYIGTGGNLTVRLVGQDDPVTFRNVVQGSVLALRLAAVLADGTTADHIVGLA